MKDVTKLSLDRYGQIGVPTGDFLKAVLSNDLFDAYARADRENINDLPEIVQYIFNELPMKSWGSREKVEAWIECSGARWGVDPLQPVLDALDGK